MSVIVSAAVSFSLAEQFSHVMEVRGIQAAARMGRAQGDVINQEQQINVLLTFRLLSHNQMPISGHGNKKFYGLKSFQVSPDDV